MKLYCILDNTAGMLNYLANEKGLIKYANNAHFIDNKKIFKANTVEEAINLLESDLFFIKPIEITNKEKILIDITELVEGKKNESKRNI